MSWGHQLASRWWHYLRVEVAVWAWEHMMHQHAACHCNATCYHTSLAICTILSERSEGGQPLGRRIMRPRKSNNLTLWTTRRARGEDSLSWGTHDVQTSYPLLTLHRMEYCLRWIWDAASASLMLIHSYPRPHVLVASIHGYIGVSRGPQALWPRVGDDRTYITTMGLQQTSVHGRTT